MSGHFNICPVVLSTTADVITSVALIDDVDWTTGIGLQKFKTVAAVRAKTIFISLAEYWTL